MPCVGGVGAYRKKCDDVAARNYEGFTLTESTP
jgi:cyclohexanone monooxygenase